jgi:hypothetical protein
METQISGCGGAFTGTRDEAVIEITGNLVPHDASLVNREAYCSLAI